MKAMCFVAIITAALYASDRWEPIGLAIIGLFSFAAAFLIFYSLYRHLAASRFF